MSGVYLLASFSVSVGRCDFTPCADNLLKQIYTVSMCFPFPDTLKIIPYVCAKVHIIKTWKGDFHV